MLASESVVLKAHGFNNFKDVKPGEAVIITKLVNMNLNKLLNQKFCSDILNTFILLDLIVY